MHPAPTDLHPWYLRDPHGDVVGADYACWAHALHAATHTGATAHLDLYAALDRADLWRQVSYAPRPRREWMPRGWGGTD